MAITQQSTLDKIEILPDGTIQVRRRDSVLQDGVEISFQFRRAVTVPTDDPTNYPTRLKRICVAVWTPAVVAAYKAAQAAIDTAIPPTTGAGGAPVIDATVN